MAITLTIEDGTGVTGANSYGTLAEAEAYFEARLYTTTWDAATDETKKAALVMATQVNDSGFTYRGHKTEHNQPRAWPRYGFEGNIRSGFQPHYAIANLEEYVAPDAIHIRVIHAQFEQALALLDGDRTGDPDNAGLGSVSVGKGAVAVTFDKTTARKTVSEQARALLSPFTAGGQGGTMRKVVRG